MKYFTKEWYQKSLDVVAAKKEKSNSLSKKHHSRKKDVDTTMVEYHKALEKIENKVPDVLHSTFHGSIIKSAEFCDNSFVITFDNSASFSDVEKIVLSDPDIIERECDLENKTWQNEEVYIQGGGFLICALLSDEKGLYYFTISFTHIESVSTDYTDSTDAGIAETLESVFDICCEKKDFDFDNVDLDKFITAFKEFSTYSISKENLYRFETGIYTHCCEEFFEMMFTRQVFTRVGACQLSVSFSYAPEGALADISDTVCSDVFNTFDEFISAIAETKSFKAAKKQTPIKHSFNVEMI